MNKIDMSPTFMKLLSGGTGGETYYTNKKLNLHEISDRDKRSTDPKKPEE